MKKAGIFILLLAAAAVAFSQGQVNNSGQLKSNVPHQTLKRVSSNQQGLQKAEKVSSTRPQAKTTIRTNSGGQSKQVIPPGQKVSANASAKPVSGATLSQSKQTLKQGTMNQNQQLKPTAGNAKSGQLGSLQQATKSSSALQPGAKVATTTSVSPEKK